MTEKIPVKKNKEYIVDIIDNGFEGEGIAKIDNYTVFVSGAIKGEKVKILILKVKSSYAFGKILEIMKKSDNRVEHDCNTYKRCGGCNLRHMKYPATLELKQLMVQNLVNKILDSNIEVKPTIGMEIPYFYRNKGQFPIGYTKEGEMTFGVYANRSHEIVPIKICKIQNLISQKITKYILKFMKQNNVMAYNEKNRIGEVRHIVIKIGIKTSEIMCILVTNRRKITQEDKLVSELVHNFPNIRSIVKNINMENTNVILGKENINLWGDGYIEDKLGEYTFKISPLSFYQTNFIQTQKLYDLA
ncbi:MAG: 23S rRNA (uracil(1939)-C(5))-methyltransferase RlmD [Clostridia bacterium]|jgi:23S rRNA (uracil1939-C5)-methyltransferase|nr:23S rRNA (uracil(1939)-C(5))-methyltransferase RlmD [Clostridia bacterium]